MESFDPLDRLEEAAELVTARVQRTQSRQAYEIANRLGLLWVHGLVATLAGIQMMLWGTASQIEQVAGPGARFIMGPVAVVGGIALIGGLLGRPRSIHLEGLGLALIALWDLAMTAGLAWARVHQNNYRVLGPHEPQPHGYVPGYPIAVYAGLLALLVIHLWTLRLLRRHQPKNGGGKHAREP